MVTSAMCLQKYGLASVNNPWLTLWHVPLELQVGNIPKKMFVNKDLIPYLTKAFELLIERSLTHELKTFDGCFNIRKIRGRLAMSLHSWAVAFDFNAKDNPLGLTYEQAVAKGLTPFTEAFLQCFRDAGLQCGADFHSRPDRMHFELKTISSSLPTNN